MTVSFQGTETHFAEIIFPFAVPRLLTYSIPKELVSCTSIGSRVVVSLGRKRVLTGIVMSCHQHAPAYQTKPIFDVLDDIPLFNSRQLAFFTWMASYYMCTLGEIFKTALPSGFKLTSQSKIYLHPQFMGDITGISPAGCQLLKKLANGKGYLYQQAEKWLGEDLTYQVVKELLKAETIILQEEVQEKFIPKKEVQIGLREDLIGDETLFREVFQQVEKNPKQLAVLLQYMATIPPSLPGEARNYFVSKKKLLENKISATSLQKMIKNNIFVEKTVVQSRIEPSTAKSLRAMALTAAQEEALRSMQEHFKDKATVLLHGVTGSGKTEIYVPMIQQALEKKGQVLYLLPEIGLATQIVQRLKNKFPRTIGVYHSKYNSNERVETWNEVLQGKVRLVIGTRSALFLPFSDLQLLIVDEEHEPVYKQRDTPPLYHTRDAALMLAHYHQAKVILGSATPSVETYYKAQKGKYGLVQLIERFQNTSPPQIKIVDMQLEQRRHKLQGEFSSHLMEALQTTLAQNEQALIFQNRRGYASYLLCEPCGWVPTCSHCAVSLTYHQYKDRLVCHYCGYHDSVPLRCGSCQAGLLKNKGFGTEKVEETLQYLFPDKKIARMDLETTRRKNMYQKILTDFEKGHTAILVGTQMITKGLDFDRVTLVGVMDMDGLLFFPDFRAHEHCFQLILQVGGRAGRRGKQGQVIVQTKNPNHPLLPYLVAQDYQQMYQKELLDRQKFRYPPYVRLIKITSQHTDEDLAMLFAKKLKEKILRFLKVENILGPQPPLVAKVKNLYRVDIWLKVENVTIDLLADIKNSLLCFSHELTATKPFRTIRVIFDVDPL